MGSSYLTAKAHRVYTKTNWNEQWTLQTNVYANRCTFSCSPDMPEAELQYNYGAVMRPGLVVHDSSTPKELLNQYVKIEIDQDAPTATKSWYGVIIDDGRQRDGNFDNRNLQSGIQRMYCRGLEFLLQRKIVDTSFVLGYGGNEIEIHRGVGFNLGGGTEGATYYEPNMWGGGNLGPVFCESLDDCEPWSQEDILQYLIAYHPPQDCMGVDQIGWQVDFGTSKILKGTKVTLHPHGKNLHAILNELIDRRRLIAWYVDVAIGAGGSETPTITVFSFNRFQFNLPDGQAIPPNSDTTVWDLDADVALDPPQIHKSAANKFDQVIARGERLGACWTISDSTTTLEKDWPTALATSYNTAASAMGFYAALDDYDKENANQRARAADWLMKVYKYFRVPLSWPGTVSGHIVCPDPEIANGNTSVKYWMPGLRFLPRLPLLTEHNYTAAITTPSSPADSTLAGSKAEYLRPFAVLKKVATEGTCYHYLDRLSRGHVDDMVEAGGIEWSASIRMQEDAFGVIVEVHGAPQHVIAATEFVACDTVDAEGWPAEDSWQNMFCTVFAEFDSYAEAKWPLSPIASTLDQLRELIIEVPNARLDYLVEGTIWGIDADGSKLEAGGGYIRDDRPRLKNIARAAYEWYSVDRNAITVTQRQLTCPFNLGNLILAIGQSANDANGVTVNTCVTSLAFDFRAQTATVTTQFAELDLGGF